MRYRNKPKFKNTLISNNAFSLVELVVSIAIVGILASLGIAQFSAYKASSNWASLLLVEKSVLTFKEAVSTDEACTDNDCQCIFNASPYSSSEPQIDCDELNTSLSQILPLAKYQDTGIGIILDVYKTTDPNYLSGDYIQIWHCEIGPGRNNGIEYYQGSRVLWDLYTLGGWCPEP